MIFKRNKSVKTSQPVFNGAEKVELAGAKQPLYRRILKYAIIFLVVSAIASIGYWYFKDPTPPDDRNDELAYREYILKHRNYEATYADYMILGNEYLDREQYEKAEEQFKVAESMSPEEFDVAYGLATLYRLTEDKDNALQYYDKAISIAEKNDGLGESTIDLYKSEKQSIKNNDFELKNVEYSDELPL